MRLETSLTVHDQALIFITRVSYGVLPSNPALL